MLKPGDQFGWWTVDSYQERKNGNGQYVVWCVCQCGTRKQIRVEHLKSGGTKSCRCKQRTAFGHSMDGGTSTYRSWGCMIERVRGKYKEKGIGICERWSSYALFVEDMGECPSDIHTIDRIDNARGYEPGNCRWATPKQQSRNTSRNNVLIVDGEALCLAEWSERIGVSKNTIAERLRRGMTPEEAVHVPINEEQRRRSLQRKLKKTCE